MKKISVKKIILYIAVLAVVYYVWLPPLHYQAVQFWLFLLGAVLFGGALFLGGFTKKEKIVRVAMVEKTITTWVPKKKFFVVLAGVVATAVLLVAVGFLGSSQILHAHAYTRLIDKQTGNFSEDIKEIPWNRILTVDRDTAIRLGNRKMGEVVELVSQFTVSDEYTQINYKGDPTRVSPLQYASPIKWFTNQKEGIPYYMKVNMINGETELVKTKSPMKYTKSEYFNRNITRHLRFQYPFKFFYRSNFEVDDQGMPYWITPVYKMTVGLFGGPDIKEVIITNAIDGTSQVVSVKDCPKWIDYVYDAGLVVQQVNWNGKYQNGFINSLIGQKGVLKTTDGYNYLAIDDDVYLYTGITSVSADESNIGFILVNMRTKECHFYSVPSAEEFSAMGSAEGAVQEKHYKATFPLLLNVGGRPTYFLSLKDEAGLIKMYAFIDAEDYQHVVTGSTVAEAYKAFTVQQAQNTSADTTPKELTKVSGTIAAIQPIVIDGNTLYYFMLNGDDTVYMSPVTLSERLPFMKPGDAIHFSANKKKGMPSAQVKLIEDKTTSSEEKEMATETKAEAKSEKDGA